jgi:hypothetical protein
MRARCAGAAPARRAPASRARLLDYIPDRVDPNRIYRANAVAAADEVELIEFPEVEHPGPIDRTNSAQMAIRAHLLEVLAPSAFPARGAG